MDDLTYKVVTTPLEPKPFVTRDQVIRRSDGLYYCAGYWRELGGDLICHPTPFHATQAKELISNVM